MGKILPILLALIGLGAGIGGGIALRPDPTEIADLEPCGGTGQQYAAELEMEESAAEPKPSSLEYVKLNNQFVIPVVGDGRVRALVVMSLNLEVAVGGRELVYQREPKLRDAFLQVLFDHANAGGFDGVFTSGRNMALLRDALKETAQKTLGETLNDVLIVDFVRQDV